MIKQYSLFLIIIGFLLFVSGCAITARNVISEPLSKFPKVSQLNTSELEKHFVENYKIDFPKSEVFDDVGSLKKCILPQARILEITNLSESVLVGGEGENYRDKSTVSYGDIALYSTSEGCNALASVTLKETKGFGAALITELPKSFRYPLYMDAAYTLDMYQETLIDNRWKGSDYGTEKIRLKRYRYPSELEGLSMIEKVWVSQKKTRQGDVDTSRYARIPSYIIKYYSDSPDAFEYLQISRDTWMNRARNEIAKYWSENGVRRRRLWSADGGVHTYPYGITRRYISGEGLMVSCSDKDGSFTYFRVENEYDCIKVAKSEYGRDGVYFDENAAWYAKQREAEKRKKEEAAERKRQQEIARKRLKAKKQAIRSYIASRQDLSRALDEVVKIGVERKAVDRFIRKNGFGRLCETGSNNTYYQSKTCLSEWKVVRGQASSHYSSLDSSYKKQRGWFAGLFGENASLVATVVDDRVASTPSDKSVEQQYLPIEQQLIRITESEARAERAESRRREQKQMADFVNHLQSTFERTNRMLDRNMAQTQKMVHQSYASQSSPGAGYRSSSRRLEMPQLNSKLDEIDRSFDASSSSLSGGMNSSGVVTVGTESSVKSAYRVCGGPATVPAMNQVFDVRGLNSGKASPNYQCPAGGKPVVAGAYNLETGNISWLDRPPTYKQEPVRGENGRPNGARVSWDAYRYECLCNNSGSGTRAGGYQQ